MLTAGPPHLLHWTDTAVHAIHRRGERERERFVCSWNQFSHLVQPGSGNAAILIQISLCCSWNGQSCPPRAVFTSSDPAHRTAAQTLCLPQARRWEWASGDEGRRRKESYQPSRWQSKWPVAKWLCECLCQQGRRLDHFFQWHWRLMLIQSHGIREYVSTISFKLI